MARKTATKIKNETQALGLLAQRFKTAAKRPNVYGYVPHEKQERFHKSEKAGTLYIGGNRSGKTTGGAVESIWRLKGEHPYKKVKEPPVQGRCVAVDFQYGVEKIVKPEIARWLPPSLLINGSWEDSYDRNTRTLELDNGSTLEFQSYDQDLEKFAGTSRSFCWFDEEAPKPIYTECKARLVDQGGQWYMTMTPVEGMTWVHDDLYIPGKEQQDPNIEVIEIDITENPHLNPGEIELFLSGLNDDDRKARKEGRFVASGGLIYADFDSQNILEPFIPPKDWLHATGMDFGVNNPTAVLWGAVNNDGDLIIYDEHYESGKVVSWHAQKIKEINASHDRVPDYYVGDPSAKARNPITDTSIQLEYMEHGIPIILGTNDVRAGILRVAGMIRGTRVSESIHKPKLYITNNCVNTLYEIRRYRWSVWAERKARFDRNKKDDPHKKDDHAMDALRYLVMSRPQIDDGKYIPENPGNFLGAPESIDPYQPLYDRDRSAKVGSTNPEWSSSVDDQLGGEY